MREGRGQEPLDFPRKEPSREPGAELRFRKNRGAGCLGWAARLCHLPLVSPGARAPLSACSRLGEMGGASLARSVLEAVMPTRCSPRAGLRDGMWSPWSLCWYFVLLSREVSLSQNSITWLPPESSEREHAADLALPEPPAGAGGQVSPHPELYSARVWVLTSSLPQTALGCRLAALLPPLAVRSLGSFV